jgi:hypothetical protein
VRSKKLPPIQVLKGASKLPLSATTMKIVLRRAAISEWSNAGSRSGPSEEYGAKWG